MNKLNRTKIDWCDYSWSPVIGCRNNCSYCYGRRLNQRFHFTKDYSIPTWIETNFNRKFPKKPSRIFVGSMSDIYFWKVKWMDRVLEKIKDYPQYTFIFLTKFPAVYEVFDFPMNCWLGVSDEGDCSNFTSDFYRSNIPNIKFISFEPLLSVCGLLIPSQINWVIVGAETGSRKGKITPERVWLAYIRRRCQHYYIPLFEKESLKPIMGKLIQEFPK